MLFTLYSHIALTSAKVGWGCAERINNASCGASSLELTFVVRKVLANMGKGSRRNPARGVGGGAGEGERVFRRDAHRSGSEGDEAGIKSGKVQQGHNRQSLPVGWLQGPHERPHLLPYVQGDCPFSLGLGSRICIVNIKRYDGNDINTVQDEDSSDGGPGSSPSGDRLFCWASGQIK